MASIPTASVDALVHVKRLRQPKNGATVHYPLRLGGASWDLAVWFTIVQSVADCRDQETISVVCALPDVCLLNFLARTQEDQDE
ncbi:MULTISPECIES: hypothetical protein [Bradyrhizobium]|uniref:hypothetical protein n=1 Tax=Bradyrhizobium TaxID=374 RepID=UPI00115194DA|nr:MULTISPECIES: hypothetical protein [Bradyrhizobium]